MWEKVKRMEMSLFQEEFVRRGLRLVHDAPDQVNLAVDTCIGYAAVLGAEVFTEMGWLRRWAISDFRFRDV